MPQIQNVNVLLSFSAGVQKIFVRINVPFRVGKIVFHPPRPDSGNTNCYLLSSSLNKGAGRVGFIDKWVNDGTYLPMPQVLPITISVEDPLFINGEHWFQVQSFTELAAGASSDLTAKVWQCIEFHEADTMPRAMVG